MEYPIVYAAKHNDLTVRMQSRSGGVFTAISDDILDRGGVVYGCVLNEKFEAIHIRAVSKEQRDRMRGSKYIQSNLVDIFKQVKNDLKNNNEVLFSGTSCQIAGLKKYLKVDYDNLLCVDIICHGVPSPLVWKKYLKYQEQINNGKVISVDFRNKKDFGWKEYIETITLKNDNGIFKVNSEIFKYLFSQLKISRPSCYKCPYKDIKHPGDITIGDYWGIEKAAPGFNDNKGVSLVLINNNKGIKQLKRIEKTLEIRECSIEDSIQPPLKSPFKKPKGRAKFWKELENKPFKKIVKKYGKRNFLFKVKKYIKRLLKRNN